MKNKIAKLFLLAGALLLLSSGAFATCDNPQWTGISNPGQNAKASVTHTLT